MTSSKDRKKELDRKRTEWRKTHRALNGRVILYPDKSPEHINARGNKIYNWFWQHILLTINMHEIPAIITALKQQIAHEPDKRRIRKLRTMIGMADDAFRLKQLEDIDRYDTEIQLGESTVYNAEQGIIFKNGTYYTTDFSEDEDSLIIRDSEGTIVDIQYGENGQKEEDDDSPSKKET